MEIKRTSYFGGLIKTYDNVFNEKIVKILENEIQNLSFKWGTRDNPDQPPTGLQCFEFEHTRNPVQVIETKKK